MEVAMDIRPIRTEADYEAALAEIERLMDAEPGTPAYDKLDVLSTLVEVYEEEHYPIPLPSPIGAIEFHMERLGLTRKDLEPYIGTRARVSEILNRQRPLTLRMIRNLEKGLGIPAAILVQDYELAQDHPPEKAEPAEDTNAASQAGEAWHTGIEQPAVA
jgi:HTH-type transcriptional regulator/antitoxin HigA